MAAKKDYLSCSPRRILEIVLMFKYRLKSAYSCSDVFWAKAFKPALVGWLHLSPTEAGGGGAGASRLRKLRSHETALTYHSTSSCPSGYQEWALFSSVETWDLPQPTGLTC
jgi:hypothetical protein